MAKVSAIPEPAWASLLQDKADRQAARRHWKRITTEMEGGDTLSPANGHALQRLVLAYIVYDRCSAEVAATGVVTVAAADNPKAIDRLSVYYKAMSEAEKTAERLEAQLGLSPQRRGKVGKVAKKRERSAGADAYRRPRS